VNANPLVARKESSRQKSQAFDGLLSDTSGWLVFVSGSYGVHTPALEHSAYPQAHLAQSEEGWLRFGNALR
jgi:hypothetical protein